MLYLLFSLGHHRYALRSTLVAEVIPLIDITPLPGTPVGTAGVINYRGGPVPVVDLAMLAFGRAAASRISTRILILQYQAQRHQLGIIAEQVTDTLTCNPKEFQPTGVENCDASYLGPVRPDSKGVIQRIEIEALLSPALRNALFPEPVL